MMKTVHHLTFFGVDTQWNMIQIHLPAGTSMTRLLVLGSVTLYFIDPKFSSR